MQIYYALNTAMHVRIRNMLRVSRGKSITGRRGRETSFNYNMCKLDKCIFISYSLGNSTLTLPQLVLFSLPFCLISKFNCKLAT